MPFGYNPQWRTWKCPCCGKVYHFRVYDKGSIEYYKDFLPSHLAECSKNNPQRTLLGTPIDYTITKEVIRDMKIPAQVLEGKSTKSGLAFIRATNLTPPPSIGANIEFTIGGDVEVGGDEQNPLYSVPVVYVYNGQKLQGQYSLNRTALRALATKLGDETTAWTGARFTSFVNVVRNPRTGTQGPGFTVLVDTVKSPKQK